MQTRSIDLPADSTFAIAMRTQQEAERAEQQRIKALVLNYDMQRNEIEDLEGHPMSNGRSPALLYIPRTPRPCSPDIEPNYNRRNKAPTNATNQQGFHHAAPSERQMAVNTGSQVQYPTIAQSASMNSNTSVTQQRQNGAGGTFGRRNQTARKLQLSDVDWYGHNVNDMNVIVNEQNVQHDGQESRNGPSRGRSGSARRGRDRGRNRR